MLTEGDRKFLDALAESIADGDILRNPAHVAATIRAILARPPTVADLLVAPTFLDGKAQIFDGIKRIQIVNGCAAVVATSGKYLLRWVPTPSDLIQPATLVEVDDGR